MRRHNTSGFRDDQPGFYAVTICVQGRHAVLGKVVDCQVQLNKLGIVIQQTWNTLPQRFAHIALHEFVVMPNHIHGIIEMVQVPQQPDLQRTPLWSIVRTFKASACYQIRHLPGHPWFCWQERYYWSVLSDESRLATMRHYIKNNPARWAQDSLYHRY